MHYISFDFKKLFLFQLDDGDFCLIPHEHSQPIKQSEYNIYIDRIFTEQQENFPPAESSKSSTTSKGIIIVFDFILFKICLLFVTKLQICKCLV